MVRNAFKILQERLLSMRGSHWWETDEPRKGHRFLIRPKEGPWELLLVSELNEALNLELDRF